MDILIVDDERIILKDIKETVQEVKPEADIVCCENYSQAIYAAQKNDFDVAFLDISIPGKNGIELAKELKGIKNDINIVFTTGYSEYAVKAFELYASGYLLKPIRTADIENAFNNLRFPIQYAENKMRVQCFGNFEAYAKNEPIQFGRSKTKEILAYMIDRKGAVANTNEICTAIFSAANESMNKHYFRNLIADLKKTLEKYGVGDVLVIKRNSFAVDVNKIECDYYKYLEGDVAAINSYCGEYMSQFSWAEMTNGFLYNNHIK